MAATGRRLTYLTSRQILRWGLCFWERERMTFVHNSMITCGRWAASRIPRQGQKALGTDSSVRADWLSRDRVHVCVHLSSRAGWWRTFPSVVEAFWGSWALGAVWVWVMPPWSKILIGCAGFFFFLCSNLVLILDKYILCMCSYVGRFLFSLRRPCWRIFSQIY